MAANNEYIFNRLVHKTNLLHPRLDNLKLQEIFFYGAFINDKQRIENNLILDVNINVLQQRLQVLLQKLETTISNLSSLVNAQSINPMEMKNQEAEGAQAIKNEQNDQNEQNQQNEQNAQYQQAILEIKASMDEIKSTILYLQEGKKILAATLETRIQYGLLDPSHELYQKHKFTIERMPLFRHNDRDKSEDVLTSKPKSDKEANEVSFLIRPSSIEGNYVLSIYKTNFTGKVHYLFGITPTGIGNIEGGTWKQYSLDNNLNEFIKQTLNYALNETPRTHRARYLKRAPQKPAQQQQPQSSNQLNNQNNQPAELAQPPVDLPQEVEDDNIKHFVNMNNANPRTLTVTFQIERQTPQDMTNNVNSKQINKP